MKWLENDIVQATLFLMGVAALFGLMLYAGGALR